MVTITTTHTIPRACEMKTKMRDLKISMLSSAARPLCHSSGTEIMITTKTLLYKHLKCIVRPHDMHKEV